MSFLSFIKSTFSRVAQSAPAQAMEQIAEQAVATLRQQAPEQMLAKRSVPIHVALRRTWHYRAEMEMKTLRTAIDLAENPYRPRRFELLRLYHEVVRDLHLASQLRVANITVQRAPWQIVKKGTKPTEPGKPANQIPQAVDSFSMPWFSRWLKHALDAEFYGHSLVEFRPQKDENGNFTEIYLIPREHVRPESGEIVLDVHHEKGLPYRTGPLAGAVMEIGDPDDLGVLLVASREVIRKKYSKTDWSRKSEKFGMPFVVLKTASQQDSEVDKKSRMLENMGSNNWGVFDDLDELQFHEAKSGENGHNLFLELIKLCDDEVSKLINGQTGTSDNKAYVGSAEVHERILNDYTFARLRRLQEEINYKLIPFLIKQGYAHLEGAEFQFTELLPKQPKTDAEGEDEGENLPKAQPQKKKPLTNALLLAWHQEQLDQLCCPTEHSEREPPA
jgi:hypothetical protein